MMNRQADGFEIQLLMRRGNGFFPVGNLTLFQRGLKVTHKFTSALDSPIPLAGEGSQDANLWVISSPDTEGEKEGPENQTFSEPNQ